MVESKSTFRSEMADYETFVKANQRRINQILNRFLWFSILIGPLMMVAIRFGIFHSVSYTTCVIVSLLIMTLSCAHCATINRSGDSTRAAIIAFLAMDILLILMNSAHIGIYITWFVVPMVSLLYCDFKIYAIAVVLNYCMMTLSVWIVSPYYASLRVDFDRAFQYFAGRMGGFTIETGIMVVAGFGLCKLSTTHYRQLIETIRNIDRQKQKEKQLIEISLTDELTGLSNRRCYDADIELYRERGPTENLVIFSIDVNRLKETNDSKGHVAGDELLIATAQCLSAVISPIGKAYRTGGDEFLAIAVSSDPAEIAAQIKRMAAQWRGTCVEGLALSVGYASHSAYPNADILGLVKLADRMMYEDKKQYYAAKGIVRRR